MSTYNDISCRFTLYLVFVADGAQKYANFPLNLFKSLLGPVGLGDISQVRLSTASCTNPVHLIDGDDEGGDAKSANQQPVLSCLASKLKSSFKLAAG